MKEYPNCGVEYGAEWIIREILRQHLTSANTVEAFEQSIADCYPETVKIGWIECDTVSAIKAIDPTSWDIAHGEWIDSQTSDDNLVTFDNGSSYYWASDLEHLIENLAPENASAATK
jgi:hypothetical protein